MKRVLRPIFGRIARSLGITELQTITSHLSTELAENSQALRKSQERHQRELAEVERLIDRRLTLRVAEQGHITTEQIDHLRNQVYEHVDQLTYERSNAVQDAVIDHLTPQIDAVQAAVIAHVTLQSEERSAAEQAQTQALISSLRRDIDLLRSTIKKRVDTPTILGSENSRPELSQTIDDSLYVALEDRFRGDQSVIRKRQKQYLPYISEAVTEETPLVDFGCGRGEWLEILKESGLHARGFDSNEVAVSECKSKGLQVEVGELLHVLRSIPDNSLGAVTFFQVFEHLPFAILLDVLRSCRRVLKDGGVLIAEVPNSETLLVGASTFWIDPTHERPLHPELLKFLATQVGFSSVDSAYSTELSPDLNLVGVDDHVAAALQRIHRALFGPGDFALIAKA